MRKNTKNAIEIEKFICDYLVQHVGTNRLDMQFHDEFSVKFGGKRIIYPFGACPNVLAMKWLKKLYNQGILNRIIIGIYAHEIGFPNWIYVYSIGIRSIRLV